MQQIEHMRNSIEQLRSENAGLKGELKAKQPKAERKEAPPLPLDPRGRNLDVKRANSARPGFSQQ